MFTPYNFTQLIKMKNHPAIAFVNLSSITPASGLNNVGRVHGGKLRYLSLRVSYLRNEHNYAVDEN